MLVVGSGIGIEVGIEIELWSVNESAVVTYGAWGQSQVTRRWKQCHGSWSGQLVREQGVLLRV